MQIEEAKQFLTDMNFKVVEGEMSIRTGEHESRALMIGVEVSPQHICSCDWTLPFDPDECEAVTGSGISGSHCRVHLIGTMEAIELMTKGAFCRVIDEDLAFNR